MTAKKRKPNERRAVIEDSTWSKLLDISYKLRNPRLSVNSFCNYGAVRGKASTEQQLDELLAIVYSEGYNLLTLLNTIRFE